jgi:hypothetical protein
VTTVVVAGALAGKPGSGGEAWVRMSWARGLRALGLDVWFVEELREPVAPDSREARWFRDVVARFGFEDRAALVSGAAAIAGPADDELRDVAASASLVNISGNLAAPQLFDAFRRRVFVDIDPGFTQFWHDDGLTGARVAGHDVHFTIGERIGEPDCPIPTGGIEWRHVRQPVLLEDWPATGGASLDRFTSVANWRGPYGPVVRDGHTYGLKVHEFRKFLELPRASGLEFELALRIDPADQADREALEAGGWRLADPDAAAGDPDAFRAYVQGSGAEFSVAQGIYVDTACGWFSDRTTRYLASGRPTLVQDTGFSRFLPVGDGLVAFATLDDAVAGARDIATRYEQHAMAARAIAEAHFAAGPVLERFCDEAGIG